MKNDSIIKASNDLASNDLDRRYTCKVKGLCHAIESLNEYCLFRRLFKPRGKCYGSYWFSAATFADEQNERFIALCLLDSYIETDGFDILDGELRW